MASTASTEASEVRRRGRRRLIGAIALVVLLVVFVPMILDPEPRPARSGPSAAIPSKENAPPLPAPPPARPEVAVLEPRPAKGEAKPAEPKASEAPAPKAADPKPDPKAAAKAPATKPAEAKAPERVAESPKLEGFAVQVGAFRDSAMLEALRAKLAAAGVVHYTERLEASSGPLTRLRAGPFATRAEAEAAQVKLRGAAIEGKVVPLP